MDQIPEQIPGVAPVVSPVVEPPKHSMKKLFIIVASLLALGIIALAAFFVFRSGAGDDVSITVDTPERVQAGVPFNLKVNISNDSGSMLKDTQIIINLPD